MQILRSCSLPDLSKLFRTTLALNPFFEVEQQTIAAAATTLNLNLEIEDLEAVDEDKENGNDEIDAGGVDDVDGQVQENGNEDAQNQSG